MILPKASGFLTTRTATHHLRPLAVRVPSTFPQQIQPHVRPHSMNQVMSYHRTSLSSARGLIPDIVWNHPLQTTSAAVGLVALWAILKYRGVIKQYLKLVQEESWLFGAGVRMERAVDESKAMKSGAFGSLRLLELNPEFTQRYEQEGWQMYSLGDYMSTLRPKGLPKKFSLDDLPSIITREIEAGLATAMLKALGPNLGRALLPALGTGVVERQAQKLASSIATNWFLSDEGSISASGDKGGVPISLMTLLTVADTNAKLNSGNVDEAKPEVVAGMNLTAIEKMKRGEIVKGPSFCDPDLNLIDANCFVMDRDFDKTIAGMEDHLGYHKDPGGLNDLGLNMAQEEALDKQNLRVEEKYQSDKMDRDKTDIPRQEYDPEDRCMGEPVPLNPRLFPGLHLGWGDAKCSHTKRETLKMRLLALLLNRLGANYDRKVHGDDSLFTVRMSVNDKPIDNPADFIKALKAFGHEIESVPSTRLTTFGLALCVKENDGSWSNIPLGIFLESGYEDKDGNMAPCMMPHSGLDLIIKGPLAGKRGDGTESELRLQHFIGIEGFCGWRAHANPEVPFNEAIEMGERLKGDDVERSVRICALYASTLNGLATKLGLPFGGYGLTAVCNDSAAVIQYVFHGESSIYPMTSIGRFMQRTMRYAQELRNELSKLDGMEEEAEDLCAVVNAMKKIPSDINASPSNAAGAASRMLATMQPKMQFLLNKDSKRVMESILEEENLEQVHQSTRKRASSKRSVRSFALRQ